MSKRRRARRRFYPEFYTDEELRRRESRNNGESPSTNIEEEPMKLTDTADPTDMPNVIVYNGYQPPEFSSEPDILYDDNVDYTEETAETEEAVGDIFADVYESENPIVYQNSAENRYAEPMETTEMTEMAEMTEIAETDEMIDKIETDETDEINEDEIIEIIDNIDNIDNDDTYVTDSGSIEIEIPEDMYITENIEVLEVPEPAEIFEFAEPVESIPVFAEPVIIEPEPEPEIEIEETPQIYTDPQLIPFDREKAIEYARRWALGRNPDYYNYEEIGGDCTNYISQTLLAGGCKMDKSSPLYGWYYNNANDKSPSWTGVEQLYDYLIKDKERGIIAKEIELDEVEAGDIVQLSFNGKTFQHTPFIVSVKRTQSDEVSYDKIKICAHSFDSENRGLDTYQWRKIRFIRILGYK